MSESRTRGRVIKTCFRKLRATKLAAPTPTRSLLVQCNVTSRRLGSVCCSCAACWQQEPAFYWLAIQPQARADARSRGPCLPGKPGGPERGLLVGLSRQDSIQLRHLILHQSAWHQGTGAVLTQSEYGRTFSHAPSQSDHPCTSHGFGPDRWVLLVLSFRLTRLHRRACGRVPEAITKQ